MTDEALGLPEALRWLAEGKEACERHSILNDLGELNELKYLKQKIERQTASGLAIIAWIEEISKKMNLRKIQQNKKLDALIDDVGKNRAFGYIAAAVLRLMFAYEILNLRGTDK